MKRTGAYGPLHALAVLFGIAFALPSVACSRDLDAGSDVPRGLLPVDNRNPIIIYNDGPLDNWQGEYAMALASSGQIRLEGIIVTSGHDAPSVPVNVTGWTSMVNAARMSGMSGIPDPTSSDVPILQRPSNGDIDSTQPNNSPGAHLIIDTAHRLSQPLRPIVVATGATLTDVADAYLVDPGVVDQVVIVSALGSPTGDGGASMGSPNGTADPWADEIVARKFRYVQVNTYYQQESDITAQRLMALPANSFSTWIGQKQPNIINQTLPDQVSVVAAAIPSFALAVTPESEPGANPPRSGQVPVLQETDGGHALLVSRGDTAGASAELFRILTDPSTYNR